MMIGGSPVRYQEGIKLTQKGVDPSSFKTDCLSIQSSSFITVREMLPDGTKLTIVDLPNGTSIQRFPATGAEGAIMHPLKPVVAIRAGQTIQLLNIEAKQLLKSTQAPEPIVFWTWINDTTIGMVSETSVYHWVISNPAPQLVFSRLSELSGMKITSYSTNPAMTWCILVGIGVENNMIVGKSQLFSVEMNTPQLLNAMAATFCSIDSQMGPLDILTFAERDENNNMRMLMLQTTTGARTYEPKRIPITLRGPNADKDFPLFIEFSKRFEFITIFSKFGNYAVYDVATGLEIIAPTGGKPIFASAGRMVDNNDEINGQPIIAIAVSSTGEVLNLIADSKAFVPYVNHTLRQHDLAFRLATKAKLGGAEDLFREQFDRMFNSRNYMEAAQLVLSSGPNLRTEAMMQRFYNEPGAPGQAPPILIYFNVLTQQPGSTLTEYESITLAKILLNQSKFDILNSFYDSGKLTVSVSLGDAIKSAGVPGSDTLALKIYSQVKAHEKVIAWMIEFNHPDMLVPYLSRLAAEQASVIGTPQAMKPLDCIRILRSVVNVNSECSTKLALLIVNPPDDIKSSGIIPPIDVEAVIRIYEENQYVKEASAILIELCNLGGFGEETGPYQTRLLELNLRSGNPSVADSMLQNSSLQYYDKEKISKLCEKAGLYERALLMYTNIDDVKRCVVHTDNLSTDFFVEWSRNLVPEDAMIIYREMLQNNQSQHTIQLIGQSVIQAQKDKISPNEVMELLLSFSRGRSDNKIDEAMYYYLSSIINGSDDPNVFYQYIVSATRMHNNAEVERVCKDTVSEYLEPVKDKIRDFLQDSPELKSEPKQIALSTISVRFGFVEDTVKYYYKSSRFDAIEYLVTSVSPASTGIVIGLLLDMDCDSQFIAKVCMAVRSLCDVTELAARLEERGRIRLLKKMIIARKQEGVTDSATLTVFGKVLIECEIKGDPSLGDFGTTSKEFIQHNTDYDHKALGNFCEKRDPTLAFMCYASDTTDTMESGPDLIRVSNESALQKLLAKFLVRKASETLWDIALSPETNPDEGNRKILIDKVITLAIPEAVSLGNEEGVTVAIKSFGKAELHQHLIELLEKIVIDTRSFLTNANSPEASTTIRNFANNPALQTLLITTSIAVDKQRVISYVKKLDNFNAEMAAPRAISAGLYEEAYLMYHKFKYYVEALNVLLEHIGFQRAEDYVNMLTSRGENGDKEPIIDEATGRKVWVSLGRAQLNKAEKLIEGELDVDIAMTSDSGFGGEDPSVFYCKCAILSFIKGEAISMGDSTRLTDIAMRLTLYNELIPYLIMNRQQQVKDANIDTALCECYARSNRLDELSEFVESKDETGASTTNNLARVQYLADLLFEEGDPALCRACVVLYRSISGWSSLTSCYLFLGEYENALKAAVKAKSSQVWRQVMAKSIDVERFDIAQQAAQCLIMGTSTTATGDVLSSPRAAAVESRDSSFITSTDPDELDYVVEYYESRGLIPQLIDLHSRCSAGVTVGRADMGNINDMNSGINMLITANKPLFTSFGKLICKYTPSEYMPFLQAHHHQCNVSQLINSTKQAHLYSELVYLYTINEEVDNALQTMIEHPTAFNHAEAKKLLNKCISLDLVYRVIRCYGERYPELLVDTLKAMTDGFVSQDMVNDGITSKTGKQVDDRDATLEHEDLAAAATNGTTPRIDIARVITLLCPNIISPFLLFDYLMSLPLHLTDVPSVNECMFNMLIESGNYAILERLVCGGKGNNTNVEMTPTVMKYNLKKHTHFDSIALASQLESHPLVFFRRIASALYRSPSVRRFSHALTVSRRDYLYSDCIKTVQLSKDPKLVSAAVDFFLNGDIIGECRKEVLASLEIADINEVRKECVAALLYRCYEFTSAPEVISACYMYGATEFCVPYILQKVSDVESFIKKTKEEAEEQRKKEAAVKEAAANAQDRGMPMMANADFSAMNDGFQSANNDGFGNASFVNASTFDGNVSFTGNATW